MHEARRTFVSRAALFLLGAVLLYLGLYAASERVIASHAKRNRFFTIKMAPLARYDHVILGASHAAALDYDDMNARLEQMTGSRILNLSIVGAGVTVNRLLLEYFLFRHQTTDVVYVVDSFAFAARQWNEDRLQDARLFYRAPFDPVLAKLLLSDPASRWTALDYLTGFSKINNADRFAPDVSEDETTRFNRSYRPIKQLDDQRIAYLYPSSSTEAAAARARYLAAFEDLISSGRSRGLQFIVVKPPVPPRIYRQLPDEEQFDRALKAILERQHSGFHDFSLAVPDERLFYDTDHLNRAGVLYFFEHGFSDALLPASKSTR